MERADPAHAAGIRIGGDPQGRLAHDAIRFRERLLGLGLTGAVAVANRPQDVAVYFCRRTHTGAELEPLRLNMFGEIENWPENFFGDEMADIAGRTLAAMQRRRELDQRGGKG